MNFLDELQSIDGSNLGGAPNRIKIFLICVAMIAIVGGVYWLFVKKQIVDLEALQLKERQHKITFTQKYEKAAQLEAYKNQLEEMEVILKSMLRQLPSKNEMSDLIVDISQTALASGIENDLFEPGPEKLQDFYAEKPISLKMKGNYHEFGSFVSGVASLPRVVILTMHDISLKPLGNSLSGGKLLLEGTAKTYRYLDENEQEIMDNSNKQGGKRR